jgi:hypothetical protein
MVKYGKFILTVAVIGSLTLLTSCFKKDVSKTTGWEYNNEKNGGFEKPPFKETKTGPGLVLIEEPLLWDVPKTILCTTGIIFLEELLSRLFTWTKPK